MNTVLVAALTSGVVTLGLEFIAKPRLEARKARILDAHQSRATLHRQLSTICTTGQWVISLDTPPDASHELRERVKDERRRNVIRLNKLSIDLADGVIDNAGTYLAFARDLIVTYVLVARMVMLSERTDREKARILLELSEPLSTALTAHTWQHKSRHAALTIVAERLAGYTGGQPLYPPAWTNRRVNKSMTSSEGSKLGESEGRK